MPHQTVQRLQLRVHGDHSVLDLEVVGEALLTQLTPVPGFLEATKRRRRVNHQEAVHPHRAGTQRLGCGKRPADVARADTGGEAVGGVVRALDDLVRGLELQDLP